MSFIVCQAVANPDLQIRGVPGYPGPEIRVCVCVFGEVSIRMFFGPSGLRLVKNKKGGWELPPPDPPLDPPLPSPLKIGYQIVKIDFGSGFLRLFSHYTG